MTNIKTKTTAVAAAVGLSLGGAAIATAASGDHTSTDKPPAGERGGPGGHGGPGHGPGGHGGRGHVDTAALAKALGVTEAKLTAALDATRPASKDKDKSKAGDDGRAAAIAKALGESESDVQAVLDANRPERGAGGPRGGGGGDRDALAKALAAKFGISQSKAQVALDGIRDDRETAFATALAKELGLDAAKVKTALDAQHPNHP